MLNLQQKIVEGLKYSYIDYEDITVPLADGGTIKDKREVCREIVGRDMFRFIFNEVGFHAEIKEGFRFCRGYYSYLRIAGFQVMVILRFLQNLIIIFVICLGF